MDSISAIAMHRAWLLSQGLYCLMSWVEHLACVSFVASHSNSLALYHVHCQR